MVAIIGSLPVGLAIETRYTNFVLNVKGGLMSSKKIIVFTCGHAMPEADNNRFAALSELIVDERPDYVISLGDLGEYNSLSSWDTRYPEKVAQGSIERDVQATNEAAWYLKSGFRRRKTKMPHFIGIQGNHEYRVNKLLAEDPRLAGETHGISIDKVCASEHFDDYYGYQNSAPAVVEVEGVSFSHFMTKGNSPRPMSGDHQSANMLKEHHRSIVVGHSHLYNQFVKKTNDKQYACFVAGCYKHPHEEDWAGQGQKSWVRGVLILDDVEDGSIHSWKWASQDSIMRNYG